MRNHLIQDGPIDALAGFLCMTVVGVLAVAIFVTWWAIVPWLALAALVYVLEALKRRRLLNPEHRSNVIDLDHYRLPRQGARRG